MFLDPTTPVELWQTTTKLKRKTTQGHDQISTNLMKESIDYILFPLTHIINKSLTSGIVPISIYQLSQKYYKR